MDESHKHNVNKKSWSHCMISYIKHSKQTKIIYAVLSQVTVTLEREHKACFWDVSNILLLDTGTSL